MNAIANTQPREVASFLQKHVSLFQNVKESSIEALIKDSRLLRLRAGQSIIKQGEYGESFYVIVSGGVSISITTEQGETKPLREMNPGDLFGELAVMGQGLRTATATAREDNTVVVEIHKIPFQKVMKSEPDLKRQMEQLFAARVIGSFLRRLRYFQGIPERDLEGLISRAKIETYKKNQLIYGEGQHTDCFYLLKVGNVKLTRARRTDEEEPLRPAFQSEVAPTLASLQEELRDLGKAAAKKP